MNSKIENFANQITNDCKGKYKDILTSVELLSMDGKLDEAINKFNSNKKEFYIWFSKSLLLIQLKLNI